MAAAARAVLLDTCALIWLINGDRLDDAATDAILAAGHADGIYVSPVSAWEIGLLSQPRAAHRSPLRFVPDPRAWFARAMTTPGLRSAALTNDIAIQASHRPGTLHSDPADRLLIATASSLGIPIVTRDQKIDYGRHGLVDVIHC